MLVRINMFQNSLFMRNRINTYNHVINNSLQKLSTGKRINSAADSPSDMLRINRFTSEVRGSQMAQRNIQDGLSFLQVSEGALTEIQTIGHRLKELSVQYNSDILTNEDKALIENEGKELLKEIQYIINNTRFGELKVFEKDSYIIQTGPYSGETYEIKMPDLSDLKEIAFHGQKNPPLSNDDNDSEPIGDINNGNNDNNTGDVGGINDDDDDNGNIGDVENGDDNDAGNVGDVNDGGNDTGNVGDINDGNNNTGDIGDGDNSGDVGGIDDDGDNGNVGDIEDPNNPGNTGNVGDDNKDTSLNGYQKLYSNNGTLIYDGFMQNGEYHGYGKLYNEEGTLLYDGFWNMGIYHQFGKVYNEEGQMIYEGDWENGEKHGFGKTFYTNGRIQYEGNWQNNKPHGFGKSFSSDGQLEYEGQWENGQPKNILPMRATFSAQMTTFSTLRMPMEVDEFNKEAKPMQLLSASAPAPFENISISDVLQNDFVDNHILKPISSAISHHGVMNNILNYRLESQIQNETIKQNTLSHITDVDTAKEIMNLIKHQMLLDTNVMLLHSDLANQRNYIYELLS